MIPELEHLKAVIEGQPNLPRWREWFTQHCAVLESILTAGQLLRLRSNPTKEIPKILGVHGVTFTQSDFYEWLDSESTSGRCPECGTLLVSSPPFTWCPNRCLVMGT